MVECRLYVCVRVFQTHTLCLGSTVFVSALPIVCVSVCVSLDGILAAVRCLVVCMNACVYAQNSSMRYLFGIDIVVPFTRIARHLLLLFTFRSSGCGEVFSIFDIDKANSHE